jgi:Uncharacterized phage-encoded protein
MKVAKIDILNFMTSQEIAELVDSRHDVVKLSIERLARRGVIQLPPLVEVKSHIGQKVEVYHIGKRDAFVIVVNYRLNSPPALLIVGKSLNYNNQHASQKNKPAYSTAKLPGLES